MKRAFLLYDAAMYDLRGKQIFDHERKFYVADHVFQKALFSGYDHGNGKILENLIFMEAISHGYTVFVGRIGDLEVDFVLEKYGKKMYIQVAYILIDTDVIEREFRSLRQISDNWPKYVISLDPFSIGTIDGIGHISAWEMEKIFE